jgi:hypothetical protein
MLSERAVGQQIARDSARPVRQRENKLSPKPLIFNIFQLLSPLLSPRGDNNETGWSAALGLV